MIQKPWQQGHFDGLCGIYSLINAIDYLHHGFSEEDCSALFEHLVRSGGSYFPQALYDGFDFEPLCNVAEALPTFLKGRSTIRLLRPFVGEEFEHVDEFFCELRPYVGPRSVAVIGLGEPWDHWTVVTKVDPSSFKLLDSFGLKRMPKFVFALEDRQGQIRLDYRETIVIERL